MSAGAGTQGGHPVSVVLLLFQEHWPSEHMAGSPPACSEVAFEPGMPKAASLCSLLGQGYAVCPPPEVPSMTCHPNPHP